MIPRYFCCREDKPDPLVIYRAVQNRYCNLNVALVYLLPYGQTLLSFFVLTGRLYCSITVVEIYLNLRQTILK